MLNDPDGGSVHPTQISTVVPIWLTAAADGGPDHWAIVRADIPDFGGWELGGYSPQAIDRWAEAGRVVPVKVRLAGAARREATDTMILNSRTPAITFASVEGMAEAAAGLAARFVELGDFLTSLGAHSEQARAADAAAVNAALAALTPGQHVGRAEIDVPWDNEDGGSVSLTVERVPTGLHLAFREPPAIDPRPINCTAGMTEDLVLAAVAGALDLDGLHSDALRQAIAIEPPEGSRLAATVPTAVGIGREPPARPCFVPWSMPWKLAESRSIPTPFGLRIVTAGLAIHWIPPPEKSPRRGPRRWSPPKPHERRAPHERAHKV